MIRWTYLIPRLVVVLVVVGFLSFGLSPLLRWAVVRHGSQGLGARIDLAALDVSLRQTRADISELAVTNPASPMRNLLEIDQGTFYLDRDALLHRKFVVREGRVSGLRFDTLRDESGAIEIAEEEEVGDSTFTFPTIDDQWIESFAGKLQEDLESELMTPGLCRQLMARYPQQYEQLRARVQLLSDRVKQLQGSIADLRRNPLQDPRVYEQLARQIAETRDQLAEVQPELNRLREMLQSDRVAVIEAKQHDEATIRQRLQWESLDPESLSQYLLGEEQTARIQSTLSWIRLVRSYIPKRREMRQPPRGGGRTVWFPGFHSTPDLLFERLQVDGQASHDGGGAIPFAGMLCDVTHQPSLLGRPVTLSIETGGTTPLQIRGVVDRTGPVARDHVVVTCPAFQQPQRQLGRDNSLALSLAPGCGTLRLEIELRGDALSGQMVLQQSDVKMEASVASAYGGPQLQNRLNQTLGSVTQFRVAVGLSGTLRRPRGKLESDLGSHLAGGFQEAFRRELDARAQQIAARLDRQVQQQLAQLKGIVDGQSEQLLAGLETPRREIEQLVAPAAEQLGISERFQLPAVPRLGKLPARDWFPR